jgi:hypothetical protein
VEIIKKKEAFKRAIAAFGPWNTWGRAHHLAYGLIRGVAYSRMEKCANDNPHSVPIEWLLYQLGAWPEVKVANSWSLPREMREEVAKLIVWVRKTPRGKRMRPCNGAPAQRAQVAS